MRHGTVAALLSGALMGGMGSLLAWPAAAELPKYQMKDLGTFDGPSSAGVAINNSGQVTGHA